MSINNRKKFLIGIGLVLSLILPFIYSSNAFVLDILISILIWATVAQSWAFLSGVGGMFSFGHTAFMGFGAYVAAYFANAGIPIILGFPFGALSAAIIALLLGFFICRLQSHYFGLVTLMFIIGMGVLFRYLEKYTGGDYGLRIPFEMDQGFLNLQFSSQMPYYFLALFILIACTVIIWSIVRSGFGLKLSAIREDPRAASAVGIKVFQVRLITFIISCSLASLAGTVYVSYYKLIEPTTSFGLLTAFNPTIYAIAGGIGNIFGGFVGATILIPLSSFMNMFAAQFPGLDRVIYGLLLMLMVLFLPKGILGLLDVSRKPRKTNINKNISERKEILGPVGVSGKNIDINKDISKKNIL